MAQITWRNINAPSFAGSAAATEAASESIARGISGLGSLATKEGERRKESNTEALLRQIQGLDTAGLAEARASGQFGAEALAGQNVDEQALFSALKGQDAAIAKQATDVFNREATARTQADAPILADYQAQLAGISDPTKIGAFTESLAGSGLSSQAQTQMLNAAKSAETSLVGKGRSEAAYKRTQMLQGREDENRRQQDAADAAINAAITTTSSVNKQNNAIVSSTAEKHGLKVQDGQLVFPQPDLTGITDPLQKAAIQKSTKDFQNQVEDEMISAGLSATKTFGQKLSGLDAAFTQAGLSPTEKAANMKTYRELQGSTRDLSQEDQQKSSADITRANTTIAGNLVLQREAHEQVVAQNPVSPEETRRQNALSVNDVLIMATDKAPQGSWVPTIGREGIGGAELRTLIQSTSRKGVNVGGEHYDVEPWMLEQALITTAQTPEESWGNPEVMKGKFKKIIELIATDPSRNIRNSKVAASKAKLDAAIKAAPLAKFNEAVRITKEYKDKSGLTDYDYSGVIQQAAERAARNK